MLLPAGTITFLFTDIGGSTRLWEEYPEAMGTALGRHDALLRQAIEAYNGTVFKSFNDPPFAEAHSQGRSLPLEQAIAYALTTETTGIRRYEG